MLTLNGDDIMSNRRKKSKKKGLIIALVIVLVIAIPLCGGLLAVNHYLSKMDYDSEETLEINPDNPQPKPKVGPEYSGVAMGPDGEPVCTDTSMGMDSAEVKRQLLALMPLIKERLHFLTDAAEMVHFLFTEPAVPPKTDIIPKKLDEAKTKEVLEKAKTFVAEIFGKSHEEAEELAKKYAEELGIKLGDFMMPVRMAVTGSRVSPPLIGSIWILGKEKAVARVEKTLATF